MNKKTYQILFIVFLALIALIVPLTGNRAIVRTWMIRIAVANIAWLAIGWLLKVRGKE